MCLACSRGIVYTQENRGKGFGARGVEPELVVLVTTLTSRFRDTLARRLRIGESIQARHSSFLLTAVL